MSSSAQRSLSFRERKIKEMGEEQFKKMEAKRKRDARAKKRGLKSSKPKWVTLYTRDGLTPKTLKKNNDNINRVYYFITGKVPSKDTLGIFEDTDKVLKFIHDKDWKLNTKIQYIASLGGLKYVDSKYTEISKIYSLESVRLQKENSLIQGDNKKTPEEKQKWVDWAEIKDSLNSANTPVDKAIIGIYTLVPPRRTGLIEHLKLSGLRDKKPDGYNYLAVDYRLNPRYILMKNYKTFKTYGEYKMELPAELKTILKKHIKSAGLGKGDMVFQFTNEIVKNTFQRVLDKEITTNILRHSYITEFLSIPRSVNEKKLLGISMGHDIDTQQAYQRID